MPERRAFYVHARLDEEELRAWIEAGWLSVEAGGSDQPLSEADQAKANLICDLKKDLGVNDEGIDVILRLLDQVHGLRRVLREALMRMKEE